MKRFLGILLFLASMFAIQAPMMAQVDVNINIALPPPIVFPVPPNLIVIPETYVYVDPDIDAELFFWNGFWWRLWEGRWYRARGYNQKWVYYREVPSFYKKVPPGWRNSYRDHVWNGHPWKFKRIQHRELERNWNRWERERHWERQGTWYVEGLKMKQRKEREKDIKREMKKEKKEAHFRRQKEHHEQMRDFQMKKKESRKIGDDDGMDRGERHGERGGKGGH